MVLVFERRAGSSSGGRLLDLLLDEGAAEEVDALGELLGVASGAPSLRVPEAATLIAGLSRILGALAVERTAAPCCPCAPELLGR